VTTQLQFIIIIIIISFGKFLIGIPCAFMYQLTSPPQQCSAIGLIITLCGSVVFTETRPVAGQNGFPITAKKNSLFTKTPTQPQIQLTARFFRADRAVGARS